MTTLVIVGNDKIGGEALQKIISIKGIDIFCDRSTNLNRVFRLIRRRKISFILVMKMYLAEIQRKGKKPGKKIPTIKSNQNLFERIKENKYKKIILFRAGLIVNKKIIDSGIDIYNIHAASLPAFAGIGSINKALILKAYSQSATLHRLTESIDSGEIISEIGYTLDPSKSYLANENIAYSSAIKLLVNTIEKS